MSHETDRRWSLTAPALERLLRRLDGEPEAAAREYDAVRHKLIRFFERRGVAGPEVLADETIDRVARRLDEGERVDHLGAYFYGVARLVALEWRKRRAQEGVAQREYPRGGPVEAAEDRERRIACLERCLMRLPEESRALLVGYYRDRGEARKRLAESHGITYTTLKTRVCRLRMGLEGCLRDCLEAGEPPSPTTGRHHLGKRP